MISSLIVLALAMAALGAAPMVPAAVLEAHFLCGGHAVQQLVLTSGAEASVRVPADCPEGGATWSLSLDCAGRCRGQLVDGATRIASLEGPAKKDELLTVKAEPKAPATVSLIAFKITDLVRVDASVELGRPVQVSIWSGSVGKSFAVEQPATTLEDGPDHVLVFEAKRSSLEQVRLMVWSQPAGKPKERQRVFDRVMRLDGDDAPFDCGRTRGFCDGPARLRVRQYRGPEGQ